MTKIDQEVLEHISELCAIDLKEHEKAPLLEDLQKMVEYVSLLDRVDTSEIEPCNHVVPTKTMKCREDIPNNSLPSKLFLNNAPDHVAKMIKVPTIISDSR